MVQNLSEQISNCWKINRINFLVVLHLNQAIQNPFIEDWTVFLSFQNFGPNPIIV